jgi:hypothetical protein
MLNLDDLPREIGNERAEAVATVFMSWRPKLTGSWERARERRKETSAILVREN